MTPTIQCFDDQSMQMPPAASILCNNVFLQGNHQTSASDRINSMSGIRTNQWNPYQRNRHLTCNSKKNTSYKSELKQDLKRLLNGSSSDEETVSEEHLNLIRKRQALLLVTIQTMALFHHNQILEHKLSVLHKRVILQIQKERNNNNKTTSD